MSALRKRLGQFASMESDETVDTLDVEVDEGGAPVDVDNLAETAMVDAQEDEAVVEEANEENEDLTETADALESFLNTAIYSAKKDGGWSRKEAYLAQIAVEQIFSKIGCADVGTSMVSYENYSDHGGNMNRVVSLENVIMDALKELWRKIKSVLNKMVAFVRKWYLKLLDGASRLKKRAQAIKKSADGKSGSTDKKKLEGSSLLKQLHVNKKAQDATKINGDLGIVKAFTGAVLSVRTASTFDTALSTFVDSTDDSDDGTKVSTAFTALKGVLSVAALTGASPTGSDKRYTNHGNTLKGSGELIGGKCIVTGTKQITGTIGGNEVSLDLPEAWVDDFSDKKVEVESGDLPMLSPSVVSGMCDKVIDILDDIINYKAGWDKYESAVKTFTKKMDKITDGKIDEDAKAKAETARLGAKAGNAAVKSQGASAKAAISLGMSMSRSVLAYGNACLGAYKN